ncbi:MAG TPA: UDP-N-acetylglucosamine--N-acetylmuramyl-(pentapeptide) pyrophosphoryl-undecaprenol N-acetylglucosamine transferase [Patescibacteria group bacterium]|nr:UDP-N-acetylglucosamine--N-acetylmuramyl-(pentapeptide) pyrophosphoryl-undecaprenol N-acetylglucosamine transferase [Patescibacteria group bacterium]
MKFVVTGGHMTPAVAVLEELFKKERETKESVRILYVGRKYAMEGDRSNPSVEYQYIPRLGVSFASLVTGRVQRVFTRYTIPSLLKIPIGFFHALFILLRFRPDAILSFGGYIAVPVVVTGWLLGIPIVTHEQTLTFGRANKVIEVFAKKIAVSWKDSLTRFSPSKAVLTGNPVRQSLFETRSRKLVTSLSQEHLPLLYITGGNQGSHALNEVTEEALPFLVSSFRIIHQTGSFSDKKDFKRLQKERERLPEHEQKRYLIIEFVDDEEIGSVYKECDLVVCRSGANTVTELAVLGKPAICIPLPFSFQKEQEKNAAFLVQQKAAVLLHQKDLKKDTFLEKLWYIRDHLTEYTKNARALSKTVERHAATKIVSLLYSVVEEKKA